MIFTYQESDVHRRYDIGRALAPEATLALMELVKSHSHKPVRLIVDLGCGTGRFTTALAETFCAPVLGIEPADNMRAAAEAKPHPGTVRFAKATADHIPLADASADLVFMSQVFHHLDDAAHAFREIRRLLRHAGRFFVRQTTRENLSTYFYQRFFPEARAVDEGRLPFRSALVSLAESSGYRMAARETVRHEIAPSHFDYLAKVRLRTYSDLESISDEAFHRGFEAFNQYCAAHPDFPRFAENDLFVFEAL